MSAICNGSSYVGSFLHSNNTENTFGNMFNSSRCSRNRGVQVGSFHCFVMSIFLMLFPIECLWQKHLKRKCEGVPDLQLSFQVVCTVRLHSRVIVKSIEDADDSLVWA